MISRPQITAAAAQGRPVQSESRTNHSRVPATRTAAPRRTWRSHRRTAPRRRRCCCAASRRSSRSPEATRCCSASGRTLQAACPYVSPPPPHCRAPPQRFRAASLVTGRREPLRRAAHTQLFARRKALSTVHHMEPGLRSLSPSYRSVISRLCIANSPNSKELCRASF